VHDWVRFVVWCLRSPSASGAFNATAPVPMTNRDFSRALGTALGRPSWAPVPGFVLRALFGEMADAALINGQRAIPKRAQELGFHFDFPTIDEALKNLLR
jgi:NAD dependent epimerase/dehydratase family enzyme